jgi:NAD(P)-dependent dehydrogenase (short-subunit alcohol dehydrogenase family)
MNTLNDRVALVTGGGRGIGRAIALALARVGTRVAVTARTGAEVEEVVGTITAEKGRAVALTADLADREVPSRLVRDVAAALGPVDILVNNAGIGSSADPKPVVEFDDAFWDQKPTSCHHHPAEGA